MPKKKPEVPPIKLKKLLQYKFTDEEINAMGKVLALDTRLIDQYKADKKSVVSEFEQKIKNLESKIMLLSGGISTGSEFRQIECEVYMNTPTVGKKSIIRTDTLAEWVETMLPEEMQEKIFEGNENDEDKEEE